MAFPASILAVVSCIWQPVMSAAQSFLGTGVLDCLTSCSGDFEEVPDSTTAIVGAEETLAEIRAHLNDDSVGIIGIYGMGGAGKTTLLSKINNDLYESRTAQGKFDLGIWVTVSKEVSIPEIQKQIADRLDLAMSGDESIDARTLFQALSQKRFLMLLDDLWAKLDLCRVGIPVPTNRRKCKIAFTTRSLDVCGDMDASRWVRVKPLDEGRSWELFHSKVSPEVDLDNPAIQPLAKQVVHMCGGLPLALITVGRAMANRRHPAEWELAAEALDHGADKIPGMDLVLSSLWLSYDYLKNDKMRSALLYCAMYPEGEEILKEELIEHWIGEGMLDDDDGVDGGIDGARNRGHDLITDLQHSCLLEAGIDDAEGRVRMHDVVRDLALWLNRREYDKVDGFMAGEDLIKGANTQRLEHVRRIWMRNFSVSPPCVQNWPPNSWTLLLNRSIVEPCVLQGIFNCMRALRVLDLSDAHLPEELPIEIHFLRDLQYLNLSFSRSIRSLPKELGKLVRLRHLYLTETENLSSIPREAIAGLSSLQVLHMARSGYEWMSQGETPAVEDRMVDDEENKQHSSSDTGAAEEGSGGRQLEVSDLEGLERLQELEISLYSPRAWQQLSRSESLRRCTRVLEVDWKYQGDDGPLQMTFTQRFDQLRELRLFGDRAHPWVGDLRISLDRFPCLEELFVSVFNYETTRTIVVEGANAKSFRRLDVDFSSGWKELKLVGKFPGLEKIRVTRCDGMEELLLDEDNEGTGSQQGTIQEQLNDSRFPKLKTLWLSHLRDLKSIGRRPLFLPSIELMVVGTSPQLRRLPLGRGSAPKLKEIWGDQEWWDGLEWGSSGDDPNIRNIFAPFLRTDR